MGRAIGAILLGLALIVGTVYGLESHYDNNFKGKGRVAIARQLNHEGNHKISFSILIPNAPLRLNPGDAQKIPLAPTELPEGLFKFLEKGND